MKLPAICVATVFTLWMAVTTLLGQGYAVGLLLSVVAVLWVVGPGSAAVNTFLYLGIASGSDS